MLIISKFHDYYDSAIGEGIDKTVVYQRNTVEIEKGPTYGIDLGWGGLNLMGDVLTKNNNRIKIGDVCHKWFTVGFCGKIYVGLEELEVIEKANGIHRLKTKTNIYYGQDCLIPFSENKSKRIYDYRGSYRETEEYIRILHEKEMTEIFFQFDVPVFVVFNKERVFRSDLESSDCNLNPRLKDFEFFKVKDTYAAFQEIQSFISGVLGTNRDPVSIPTDKEKILSHGFDNKWSFRNPDASLRKMKNDIKRKNG